MIRQVKTTAGLKSAFKNCRSGDVIVIDGSGNYELEPRHVEESPEGAALVLRDVTNVRVIGAGKPIIRLRAHGTGLLIQRCAHVDVEHIGFSGLGPLRGEPNRISYALLQFHGTNQFCSVDRCQFMFGGSHGIAHLWGHRTTHDCRFTNNYFFAGGNFAREGLTADGAAWAVGGRDNLFAWNTVEEWLRGAEIENNLPPTISSRSRIENNTFIGCPWQSIIVTPDALNAFDEGFQQISIRNNVIVGTGKKEGELSNTGIYVSGGRSLIISGNSIRDIADGIGILLIGDHGDVRDSLIEGNLIEDCGRTGLQLSPGAKGAVFENTLRGNELRRIHGRGVLVDGKRTLIESNRVCDCDWEGFYEPPPHDAENVWRGNLARWCAKPSVIPEAA